MLKVWKFILFFFIINIFYIIFYFSLSIGFREKENKSTKKSLRSVKFAEDASVPARKTYTTSWIRLNITTQQLMGSRGQEFCRRNKLDYGKFIYIFYFFFILLKKKKLIYLSFSIGILIGVIEVLKEKNIRCTYAENIPDCMMSFTDYVRYNIARKLDKSATDTKVNQERALYDDIANNCCYLNIDLLTEDPTRLIEKFIEECQYKHTREQKILLGIVEDNSNPFYLKPVTLKPNPDRPQLIVNNVNWLNEAVMRSLFNTYGDSYNDDLQLDNGCFSQTHHVIEEDIEEWAMKEHFKNEGKQRLSAISHILLIFLFIFSLYVVMQRHEC